MKWIVATPRRDISSHSTREAAFKAALSCIRRGIGRRNLDVYKVVSTVPLDPSMGLGYRISESWDIRVRDGRVIAQRYRSNGESIGRPYDLGADRR